LHIKSSNYKNVVVYLNIKQTQILETMNNLDNTYKAIELGGSWIAEANGNTWTGKYYKTEKGAQRAANKANKMAGLV